MVIEATAVQPLWDVCDAWLRRAEQVISGSTEALNTLNVFPIPDADTGSNLRLTLGGIATAVPTFDRVNLDTVVQAAILSAHGNSGAILAEMITSVCRALQHGPTSAIGPSAPGVMVADLMRRVARAATQAVARPVAGTILTVADATADEAARAASINPGDPLLVALAAQRGAREALARTPEQLEVLARAGVVDAGGQAFVLLVDVLVEVLGGPVAKPLTDVAPPIGPATVSHNRSATTEYEVMYALRGAAGSAMDGLRAELSELGHSVVIVGDQTVAQVHVHLADPGAAVEAGLALGRLSQIRITALEPERVEAQRSVLSLMAGDGLADAVRDLGGVPVRGARGPVTLEELTGAVGQTCGDTVILPNDMENLEIASHLAVRLRSEGRRVAVIPTVAQVQGLAAMAVHEPTADFDSAVVAMSTAAGHTRHGAVTIAESSAMTMAGRCRPGDVLGVIEGDFVEIGTSATEVGWRIVQRLLAAGGELLTLIEGAEATPGLVQELERRTLHRHDAVDVETLMGGQPRYLVLIGVE